MGKKRIGVLLCGCGNRDGSEIHEATCTLLAIDLVGAQAICFSPKGPQHNVCNYVTGEEVDEVRDMLSESARIARGDIKDLANVKSTDIDALIMPGGGGAARNLSTYVEEGLSFNVNLDVERLVADLHKEGKPIGAICIAPVILAKVFENLGVSLTMTAGIDDDISSSMAKMGHRHINCSAADCVIDAGNGFVSTPAYMTAKSIGEVWSGIEKLVNAVVRMA